MEASEKRLLSVYEAAETLGLSPWTLRLWVQQGKIASHKIGARRLIARTEIERIIQDGEQPRSDNTDRQKTVAA